MNSREDVVEGMVGEPSIQTEALVVNGGLPTATVKSYSMNVCAKVFSVFMFLFILAIVPAVAFTVAEKDDITKDKAIYRSAASFSILTNLISSRSIYLHISNWYLPKIQKYALVILFMPPVWATGSFLAMRFYEQGEYVQIALELYEAMALVSLLFMFLSILGGGNAKLATRERVVIELLKTKDASCGEHRKCFVLCFSTFEMGEQFYYEVKWGILQVIILKVLYTVTALTFILLGYYDTDGFGWFNAYTYVTIGGIISMIWSFYSLKMFYWALGDDLSHPINWHPGWKLVCFKGILILSMIQGKVISILVATGVITGGPNWNVEHISLVLMNLCICIEMVFMSILNSYVFSYKECLPREQVQHANNISYSDRDHSKLVEANASRKVEANASRIVEPNDSRIVEPNASRKVEANASRKVEANASRIVEPNVSRIVEPNDSKIMMSDDSDFECVSSSSFDDSSFIDSKC